MRKRKKRESRWDKGVRKGEAEVEGEGEWGRVGGEESEEKEEERE